MKKIIIYLSIFFFCIASVLAQGRKESREKIKTLKIAYITEQLKLTPKEAQKFWPVYNNHDSYKNKFIRDKILEIRKEIRTAGNVDNLDDKRAETMLALMSSLEKKKYEENQKYIEDLKKIISVKKILKLQIAEMEFGKKLMRKYRRRE
jgi:hypothetical protein